MTRPTGPLAALIPLMICMLTWGCTQSDPALCVRADDCAGGDCLNGVCIGPDLGGDDMQPLPEPEPRPDRDAAPDAAPDMHVVPDMRPLRDTGPDPDMFWEPDAEPPPLTLTALGAPVEVELGNEPLFVETTFELRRGPVPVRGVPVWFSASVAHGRRFSGDFEPDIVARTDADGQVTARLRIHQAGALVIDAEADHEGDFVRAEAPLIIVRDRRPSGDGLHLDCASRVVPAFLARDPETGYVMAPGAEIPCTLTLATRLGERIDGVLDVVWMREAGTFGPTGLDAEGRPTTAFAVDANPPYDVDRPAGEAPAGFEGFEPVDGLVRVVGAVWGAESFVDVDGDDRYSPGIDYVLPAQDLHEPFVDVDGDGLHDEDLDLIEPFIDLDGNGIWSQNDGDWTALTRIWTSTDVLYTGALAPARSRVELDGPPAEPLVVCPEDAGPPIAAGGEARLTLQITDANGNCVFDATAELSLPPSLSLVGDLPPIDTPCFDDLNQPGAPVIEVPIAVAPVEAMTVTELAVGVDYLDARGNRRQHRFVVPVCIAP